MEANSSRLQTKHKEKAVIFSLLADFPGVEDALGVGFNGVGGGESGDDEDRGFGPGLALQVGGGLDERLTIRFRKDAGAVDHPVGGRGDVGLGGPDGSAEEATQEADGEEQTSEERLGQNSTLGASLALGAASKNGFGGRPPATSV